MLGWAKAAMGLVGLAKGAPSIDQSKREAAQNTLGKGSKIETATDAVFAHQFHLMGQDEIDTVADYRMKKLGIGNGASKGTGERHSDLIIADQMKFESPQQNNNGLITALLGAGVALGAVSYMQRGDDSPPPAVQPPPAVVQPAPTFPPGTDTFNKIKPLPGE